MDGGAHVVHSRVTPTGVGKRRSLILDDMQESLTTVEAAVVGVSRATLRSSRWCRSSHGLYTSRSGPQDLASRCHALLKVLPRPVAFCGPTALLLQQFRTPTLPALLPVFVTVPTADGHPRRAGIRLRQANLPVADVREFHGLPVTSAFRTVVDLAGWLGLLDLLVVIDGMLYDGRLSGADLLALAAVRRRRGVRTLRRAVELADGRSESAYETLLRLLFALAGIPVQPQLNVYDDAGTWLARADLLIEGTRRLPEYDGETHRGRERHESDLARDKRLSRAGYERYGYTAKELFGSPEVIVADAEDALGWPRRLDRLAGWFMEYRKSLFYRPALKRFEAHWCAR